MHLKPNIYIIWQYWKEFTLEQLWEYLTGSHKNVGRVEYLSVRRVITITPEQIGLVGGFLKVDQFYVVKVYITPMCNDLFFKKKYFSVISTVFFFLFFQNRGNVVSIKPLLLMLGSNSKRSIFTFICKEIRYTLNNKLYEQIL